MAGELSKTDYDTRDKAAMGGFYSIREHHKTEWERKQFGFFVVLVIDKSKPTYHYTQPEAGEGTRVSHGDTVGPETPRFLPHPSEI